MKKQGLKVLLLIAQKECIKNIFNHCTKGCVVTQFDHRLEETLPSQGNLKNCSIAADKTTVKSQTILLQPEKSNMLLKHL